MSSIPSDNVLLKIGVFGIFMPLLFVFMIGVILFEWLTLIIQITFLALSTIFTLPDRIYTMTVDILNEVQKGE